MWCEGAVGGLEVWWEDGGLFWVGVAFCLLRWCANCIASRVGGFGMGTFITDREAPCGKDKGPAEPHNTYKALRMVT